MTMMMMSMMMMVILMKMMMMMTMMTMMMSSQVAYSDSYSQGSSTYSLLYACIPCAEGFSKSFMIIYMRNIIPQNPNNEKVATLAPVAILALRNTTGISALLFSGFAIRIFLKLDR